ncbi:hypothetical protein KM043_017663 [Ampulex compressa]|nr:hypothetical protein KM043_017663 [Ampulex compressa]
MHVHSTQGRRVSSHCTPNAGADAVSSCVYIRVTPSIPGMEAGNDPTVATSISMNFVRVRVVDGIPGMAHMDTLASCPVSQSSAGGAGQVKAVLELKAHSLQRLSSRE